MAEEYHTTGNPGPAAIYPAPEPGEAFLTFCVRTAILTAIDRLQAATEEYGGASAVLAEALGADADARLNLEYLEDDFRARAYTAGVPGANQAARDGMLATALAVDPDIDEARQARDKAHCARLQAEHDFRVADQLQKSLKVRLEALTALVHNAGEAGR